MEQKATQVEKKILKLWKRYKITGVQADYVQYKVVMDRARTEVRKAKEDTRARLQATSRQILRCSTNMREAIWKSKKAYDHCQMNMAGIQLM